MLANDIGAAEMLCIKGQRSITALVFDPGREAHATKQFDKRSRRQILNVGHPADIPLTPGYEDSGGRDPHSQR